MQSEDAYRVLETTGVLHTDKSQILDDSFIPAYDWLAAEMKKRIGEPPSGVAYPLWAWYQWEGNRKRRDLRCSGYAERGTPLVQLTIEIPDDAVVLSDFDDWHYVLNFWYYAMTEQESNAFEAEYEAEGFRFLDLGDPEVTDNRIEKYRKRVRESWQHIFDLWKESEYSSYPIEKKSIQATFWELRREQVLKAEHFIAK